MAHSTTMTYFTNRLQEVNNYFLNGDVHLGYRRLLDAAIETNNFDVYAATLQFCDWYDADEKNKTSPTLHQKVQDLLAIITNGYKENTAVDGIAKIEATGISKKYTHGKFSLSKTDVTLHTGQIIGLVGENGNGKTTLLRLLNGELQSDSGTISYRYKNSSTTNKFFVKSGLAFIPQRPQSWYGGLMENLQYASCFTGYKGHQNFLWTEMIIARMGLRQFRTYNWSRISSGYKMRFELARTLIQKPEVLLLDEPLANLDMLAQQIILEDLRYLAQSHTAPLSIILSSQQLYEVEKVSDSVIFLRNGVAQIEGGVAAEKAVGLTIELETTADRTVLQKTFGSLPLQKLSFNGGVYILSFENGATFNQALAAIAQEGLQVKYIRDISSSSRRFF
ncbi:MAG: ABC transporter ATP-binding protein [Bacteroidota bacterium]